jgi:hypothetical protein
MPDFQYLEIDSIGIFLRVSEVRTANLTPGPSPQERGAHGIKCVLRHFEGADSHFEFFLNY